MTCLHVWEYFATRKDGQHGVIVPLFGNGYTAVQLVQPTLIAQDERLDLAVIDLDGLRDFGEKRPFVLEESTIHRAARNDTLVILGFAGMWRESRANYSGFKYGALPFVVGDISRELDSIIVSEGNASNNEVFGYLDTQPRINISGDSCGGLSGAPAFSLADDGRSFKLAGFVRERAHGALILTAATCLGDLLQSPECRGEAGA